MEKMLHFTSAREMRIKTAKISPTPTRLAYIIKEQKQQGLGGMQRKIVSLCCWTCKLTYKEFKKIKNGTFIFSA